MVALVLRKIDYKILVVGPIYDKIEKFERIQNLSSFYDLVIINGNLCYPFDDLQKTEKRIKFAQNNLFNNQKIIYNVGQYDLVFTSKYTDHEITKWINDKPNVIIIEFKNQSRTIVTGGGVTPEMNLASLTDNLETSFVSHINSVPWHKKYHGKYGYIVANNPLTMSKPEFHRFSAQIGNKYEENFQVYAQEVGSKGLEQTILL